MYCHVPHDSATLHHKRNVMQNVLPSQIYQFSWKYLFNHRCVVWKGKHTPSMFAVVINTISLLSTLYTLFQFQILIVFVVCLEETKQAKPYSSSIVALLYVIWVNVISNILFVHPRAYSLQLIRSFACVSSLYYGSCDYRNQLANAKVFGRPTIRTQTKTHRNIYVFNRRPTADSGQPTPSNRFRQRLISFLFRPHRPSAIDAMMSVWSATFWLP